MDKQEIIQAAVQLEEDGKSFYLDAAARSSNPAVKDVLESLAKDEENHIKWIRETLGAERSARELNQETYGRVKHIFAQAPEETKEAFKTSKDDIQPLQLAVEREQKTWKAYQDWAGEVNDPSLKALLEKLVEVEKFHERLLENTILYLEDPATFHQKDEGWLLDGA